MHVRWNRQQLRTNHQEVLLCPHEAARPWVTAPSVVHLGKVRWKPGPPIRECCLAVGKGLAIAAWWWEVEQRFAEVLKGLPDENLTKILDWQLDGIEELLEEVVPKPSKADRQSYIWYREDLGLERELKNPAGFSKLGLKWPCTRQDLDARWKELARATHPDQGGNPIEFMAYTKAYQAAKSTFERPL